MPRPRQARSAVKWTLTALALVLAATWVASGVYSVSRLRSTGMGGYSLAGLADGAACPECGANTVKG